MRVSFFQRNLYRWLLTFIEKTPGKPLIYPKFIGNQVVFLDFFLEFFSKNFWKSLQNLTKSPQNLGKSPQNLRKSLQNPRKSLQKLRKSPQNPLPLGLSTHRVHGVSGTLATPMLIVEGPKSQEMVLKRASERSKSEGQSSEKMDVFLVGFCRFFGGFFLKEKGFFVVGFFLGWFVGVALFFLEKFLGGFIWVNFSLKTRILFPKATSSCQ